MSFNVDNKQPEDRTFRLEPIKKQIQRASVLLHDNIRVSPSACITRQPPLPPPTDKPGYQNTYAFRKRLWVAEKPHKSSWVLHEPTVHHPAHEQFALYKLNRTMLPSVARLPTDQWAWVQAEQMRRVLIQQEPEPLVDESWPPPETVYLMAEPKKAKGARARGGEAAGDAMQVDAPAAAANVSGSQPQDGSGDVEMEDAVAADGVAEGSPEAVAMPESEARVTLDVSINDETTRTVRVVVNGLPSVVEVEREDGEMMEIEDGEIFEVEALTALKNSASPSPTAGTVALPGNATALHDSMAPPPKKKAKYFTHSKAVFPNPPPNEGTTIINLPNELLEFIFAELDLGSLVALAKTNRHMAVLLSSDWAIRNFWQPGRARFVTVPLPPPNPVVDGGWGCARSELDWAAWALGGGDCAFCGEWTDEPPASFALNIHVCLTQECRAHWRKECQQHEPPLPIEAGSSNSATVSGIPSEKAAEPDIAAIHAQIEDEILDQHEEDKSKRLAAAAAHLPFPALFPIAEAITKLAALSTYIISSRTNVDLVRQRAPDEQPVVLCAMLAADGRSEHDAAMKQAQGLKKAALQRLRKKRGFKKAPAFPHFLCQAEAFRFACKELKDYVVNGLAFVECSPQHKFGSLSGQSGLSCYIRRKYRRSDLQDANSEWCEAQANGHISELIAHWRARALHLEDKMMYARELKKWKDQLKKTTDMIKMKNDLFLRKHIVALSQEPDKSTKEKEERKVKKVWAEWHDASNAPTLVRMRTLSELAQTALTPETWSIHKEAVARETKLLHERRKTRERAASVQMGRCVVQALYAYCREQGLGPMPPFRIFQTLPTPQACPATVAEVDGGFISWIPRLRAEIEGWREEVKTHLRERALEGRPHPYLADAAARGAEGLSPIEALPEALDWSTSLFKCQTCDEKAEKLAEEQYRQAHAAFKSGKAKKAPSKVKPKYKAPMTWDEAIEHECDLWDVDAIQKHLGGAAIAKEACRTMGWQPKMTTKQDLVRLGKMWRCDVPNKAEPNAKPGKNKAPPRSCGTELSWEEMVGHFERHDEHMHFGGDTRGLIVRICGKTVDPFGKVSEPALPNDICTTLERAHVQVRDATIVHCARCDPGAHGERKKLTFDGLKDHLKQKHKISPIRKEDMIMVVNGLDRTLPDRVIAKLPHRPNGRQNAREHNHQGARREQ